MKNDILISVRLPASLIDELKLYAHRHHYVTVSELLRSIIREQNLKDTKESESDSEILNELRKLKEQMKHEKN